MSSPLLLDHQLTAAYAFLRDCRDEEPREFGVEFRTARLRRRHDGSFAETRHPDWGAWSTPADEDELIAQLESPASVEHAATEREWQRWLADAPAPEGTLDEDGADGPDDEPPTWLAVVERLEAAGAPATPARPDANLASERGFSLALKGLGMGRARARLHGRHRRQAGVRAA